MNGQFVVILLHLYSIQLKMIFSNGPLNTSCIKFPENTYKTLNEGKNKIGKLWKERIDKIDEIFIEELITIL